MKAHSAPPNRGCAACGCSAADKLTGLADRWSWEAQAPRLLRHAQESVALLMTDLDQFKRVNDVWGHLAGDAVLAAAAQALRGVIGDEGLIGRYGGDEFLALLACADGPRAVRCAEAFREAISGLAVPVTATTGDRIVLTGLSVSVGMTVRRADEGSSLEQLVLAADAALPAEQLRSTVEVRTTAQAQGVDHAAARFPEADMQALERNACWGHLIDLSRMVADGRFALPPQQGAR